MFPCHSIVDGRCSCGDPACGSPGKHPRTPNGVKAATRSLETLRSWLTQFPDANWAVATGDPSGIWVLDIDKHKHDGQASLDAWLSESHAIMPKTRVVATGGGGWHYYFAGEDGLGNRTNLLPGVDVRSTGGYVLLPGSNHLSGGTYSVARDVEPRMADERLVALARSSPPKTAISSGASLLDPIPEGERDDTLFRMACSLRRKLGDDRAAVEALVLERARRSGFSEKEALRKVDQAFVQDHSDDYLDLFVSDAPRVNLRGADEIRTMPRPPYLIEGVLPEGALFQVFGQTGSYKSFVMLGVLASVANGIPWMGHEVNAPGPVAFVLGEGGYDAGVRMDAWMLAHPSASDARIAYSIEEQLDLMDSGAVEVIIEDLEAYRLAHFPDQPWRLIVFDTQADHMPSGDEDKSRDFTVMKRSIQRIAHATGAAVGLVHHTGWDDSRERGSSRQRQALDVVMQVKNQRVTNIKQKAGPVFDPIAFEIEAFGDSIVVQHITPVQAASETMDADLEMGRDVLTYLVDHPGASGNSVQRDLNLGRSGTWPRIRDLLDELGLLEVARDANGKAGRIKASERGLAFYGIASGE
jgi:Bifunctional DNA primase/polymerase, N-terminal/AAA domain